MTTCLNSLYAISGPQLREAVDRTEGGRKERAQLHGGATPRGTGRHLPTVRLQQGRQPKRHQLREHATHVNVPSQSTKLTKATGVLTREPQLL